MSYILSVENLYKTYYAGAECLHDISFRLSNGQTLGITGHNGSGKSTLLKILAGILMPTKGSFSIKGTVGSVIELGSGFHPELSGMDNLYFAGQIMGLDKAYIKSRIEEIVAFAEMEKHIHAPVKSYSSGMYLRLAFSLMVNLDVDLLLLDEVTSVGDTAFRIKCMQKIHEIHQSGKSIVLVSHSLFDLNRICDNILILENGHIKDYGNTDILHNYSKRMVKKGTIKQEFESEKDGLKIFDLYTCTILGERLNEFKLDEDIVLIIDYARLNLTANMSISVGIVDIFDTLLFFQVYELTPSVFSQKNEHFKLKWQIPKGILNKGVFFFRLSIHAEGVITNIYHNCHNIEVTYHVSNDKWHFAYSPIQSPTKITCERI